MSLSIKDFEGYLQEKGVSPDRLNSKCSDEHLVTVSRDVDDWQIQAPNFGLDASDVKAIKRDYDEEVLRRRAMLFKWKQMKAFKATYRELVSAFLKGKRADHAKRVCDVLAESEKGTTVQTTTTPTSGASEATSTQHTPPSTQPDFTQFGEPTLSLLMNLTGCEVKSKWREIGGGLKVAEADLKSIQAEEAGKDDSTQHCMRRVFTKWQAAMTSPYTWQNLANVLVTPDVNEKAAMLKLYKSLSVQKKD